MVTILDNISYISFNEERKPILFGDQFMLRDLLNGQAIYETIGNIPENISGSIVTFSLHHNEQFIDKINEAVSHLKWVIFIMTGNEYGSEYYKKLNHPNKRLWIQTPKSSDVADTYVPLGYPTKIKRLGLNPQNDWFFSGQVNHDRRIECVRALKHIDKGLLIETAGFGQGLKHDEYLKQIELAKVVPCPGGPVTPDSFRVYETLELGRIPILDEWSGKGSYGTSYWQKVFGKHPLKTISNWSQIGDVINDEVSHYEKRRIEIASWWNLYKSNLIFKLNSDILELSS